MNIKNFIYKYWTAIAIIIIISLGFYVRVADYPFPYLRNIDSYTSYRWMDEIVKNNGVLPRQDTLVLSPVGAERELQIYPYPYLGALSYMFIHNFIPNLELWQYLIYFPAFLAALATIPMYFIGKILYDKKAGVLAAFFIVFDISNMSRSLGGDPDTDAIVILFPLIIMALFLFTYKFINATKTINKKMLLYSVIIGIALGLWAHTWAGYWYVTQIITGFLVLKIMIDFIITRKIRQVWDNSKHILLSFVIFMLVLIIMVVPFFGWVKITSTVTGPLEFQSIKSEEGISFPNVYVSVAELQESGGFASIIQRTSAVGGIAILVSPFFLMVYAILYLIYSFYKTQKHMDTIVLLLIWFIGPLLATMIAIRFSMLFSAPMAIGSGIILSKLLRMLTREDNKIEE